MKCLHLFFGRNGSEKFVKRIELWEADGIVVELTLDLDGIPIATNDAGVDLLPLMGKNITPQKFIQLLDEYNEVVVN